MEPEYFKYIGKWVTDEDWGFDSYCLVKKIEDDKIYYNKCFEGFRTEKEYNGWWRNNKGSLRIVETSEVIEKAKEYKHDLKSLGLEEKNDYSQYIGQWVTYPSWNENSYCIVKEIKNNALYLSIGFEGKKKYRNVWWSCNIPENLKIIPSLKMSKILQQFGHTELVDTLLDVPEIFTVKKVSKELIINYPFSTELNTLPEIKLEHKQFKF